MFIITTSIHILAELHCNQFMYCITLPPSSNRKHTHKILFLPAWPKSPHICNIIDSIRSSSSSPNACAHDCSNCGVFLLVVVRLFARSLHQRTKPPEFLPCPSPMTLTHWKLQPSRRFIIAGTESPGGKVPPGGGTCEWPAIRLAFLSSSLALWLSVCVCAGL